MPPASKRRKLDDGSASEGSQDDISHDDYDYLPEPPFEAATVQEKQDWPGFCEIESDPALFNVMLQEFGVKGVKVHEVFSLDDEMLAFLPQPIFGIIFLFRYGVADNGDQEESCPPHVWFANQTHDNVCASVAMLNIVMNIPGIELGNALLRLKDATAEFPPAERGNAVGNFEFVKDIHNTFARKIDMMNIDNVVESKFNDRKQAALHRAKSTSSAKNTKQRKQQESQISEEDYEDESAFHFIAYVPIDDEVWKLDGLDRQPQKAGKFERDAGWMATVKPLLEARMLNYEADQIEFNILALCHDNHEHTKQELEKCDKSIQAVEEALHIKNNGFDNELNGDSTDGGARNQTPETDSAAGNPPTVSPTAVASAGSLIQDDVRQRLAAGDMQDLAALRQELEEQKDGLTASLAEHTASTLDDQAKADERRRDHGPFLHTWLKMLAENEELVRELVETYAA